MKILFLDDMKSRFDKFRMANIGRDIDWAETAEDAIRLLQQNSYDLISLDHDLIFAHYNRTTNCAHKDGLCGGVVAQFIAKRPRLFSHAKIHVHTLSYEAGQSMTSMLKGAYLNAHRRPFSL